MTAGANVDCTAAFCVTAGESQVGQAKKRLSRKQSTVATSIQRQSISSMID